MQSDGEGFLYYSTGRNFRLHLAFWCRRSVEIVVEKMRHISK